MRQLVNSTTPSVAVLRPSAEWLQVLWGHSAPPFDLTAASQLCDIPGIRLTASPDHAHGKLEIPRNAERLAAVRSIVESLESSSSVTSGQHHHVVTDKYTRKPYFYQIAAAEVAVREGRLLLCDEMGLGKTTSAILAVDTAREVQSFRGRPVVIVGPKILRTVWQRELIALGLLRDKYDPAWLALSGTSGRLPAPPTVRVRFVFVHYEILSAWWNLLTAWRPFAVVLDEAHMCKNPKSQRGKAALLVTTMAPVRIVLTGTPILNRLGELYSLLSLAVGPWTFGSGFAFRQRYAGAIQEGLRLIDTHPTHVEELQERLEGIYVRRMKSEVGLELPALTRQMIDVPLEENESAAYRKLLDGHTPRDVTHALIHKGSQKALKWIAALRKISSDAKISATVEHVTSLLEQEQNVVVFTWQRATAERIVKAVAKARTGESSSGICTFVHGELPQAERDVRIDQMQAQGGLLVATFGALAVGVTLTRASRVVMHDLHEVPGIMLQAEARVWRIGSKNPVVSDWMIAQGTSDEIIAKIFEKKGAAIAALGDHEAESLAEMLSTEEIEDLFGDQDLFAWAGKGSGYGR